MHGVLDDIPAANSASPEQMQLDLQQAFEREIEARLARLGKSLTRWADAPLLVLLGSSHSVREAYERLVVQQVALGWIIRIAKRSEGDIRSRLWLDIETALSDLERVLAWVLGSSPDLPSSAQSESLRNPVVNLTSTSP